MLLIKTTTENSRINAVRASQLASHFVPIFTQWTVRHSANQMLSKPIIAGKALWVIYIF